MQTQERIDTRVHIQTQTYTHTNTKNARTHNHTHTLSHTYTHTHTLMTQVLRASPRGVGTLQALLCHTQPGIPTLNALP